MGSRERADERSLAFLFSGHGAQTYQMGRAIYEGHARFRAALDRLDGLVRRRSGRSVLARLYDDDKKKADPLDDIRVSHPAIFMVEAALGLVLAEAHGPPDFVLGASLGELVAATLSGAVALEAALDKVVADAEILAANAPPGGMLAILADCGLYDDCPELAETCEIAALVDSSHFVVAGGSDGLARVEAFLTSRGIDFIRLPVRYPFHSAGIEGLRDALAAPASFGEPRIPVVSCTTRGFVRAYSPEHLWQSVRGPLHVGEALARLEQAGAMRFVDLGPGSSFAAGLTRRKTLPAQVFRVLTPFGNELANFLKLEAALATARERVT